MDIKNEMHFSPSLKLCDLDENNIINAFKERIEEWYFKPIEILNQQQLGFASTSLIACLIDILAKTEKHDLTNNDNRSKYIKWLKSNLDFAETDALNFYKSFRCGLLHAGCIESGGYISYNQKKIYISYKGSIIVNPNLLFQMVHRKFSDFLKNENPIKLMEYLKGRLTEIQ